MIVIDGNVVWIVLCYFWKCGFFFDFCNGVFVLWMGDNGIFWFFVCVVLEVDCCYCVVVLYFVVGILGIFELLDNGNFCCFDCVFGGVLFIWKEIRFGGLDIDLYIVLVVLFGIVFIIFVGIVYGVCLLF